MSEADQKSEDIEQFPRPNYTKRFGLSIWLGHFVAAFVFCLTFNLNGLVITVIGGEIPPAMLTNNPFDILRFLGAFVFLSVLMYPFALLAMLPSTVISLFIAYSTARRYAHRPALLILIGAALGLVSAGAIFRPPLHEVAQVSTTVRSIASAGIVAGAVFAWIVWMLTKRCQASPKEMA